MSQHGIAGRGLEILAAGAPLQTIVGAVLASQTHSSNWQQASQSACHLIATSKHFQQAVDSCYGVLPVDFGPLASPEAAAAFAAWLSKHGHLLSQLELKIRDPDTISDDRDPNLSPEQIAAAEQAIAAAQQAIAAALQEAAAAAAGQSGGLHIASCKIDGGDADSSAILQALPGRTLTSLVYSIALPTEMPDVDVTAALSRVGHALSGLQQLQALGLNGHLDCYERVCMGPALVGCSSLTQLTSVRLLKVQSGEGLQHLPASLVELYCDLPDAAFTKELRLGHLTAVIKLEFSEYNTLNSQHILPPNTQQLTVGSMIGSDCLLPLRQLRKLTMLGNEFFVTPAAALRQLSVLTSLASVDLTYVACAEAIASAADGWGAVQMRSLDLSPYSRTRLTRDTLLALASVTGLWSLRLHSCDLQELQPAQLGAVFGQLTSLVSLTLENVRLQQQQPQQQQQQQQQQEEVDSDSAEADSSEADSSEANSSEADEESSSSAEDDDESSSEDDEDANAPAAAAAESPLAPLLCSLAARWPHMQLRALSITGQHVDRAAAAALARLVGLQALELSSCQLEDCSVIDIVLGLRHRLTEFGVPGSRGVTDACLPVLRSMRMLTGLNLFKTGVTRQGKQRYLPQRLWLNW